VLHENDYANAVETCKRLTGKGISRQAFAIVPKVREVDELLGRNERLREMVREVHPELCFWALNGRQSMQHRKKCAEGHAERMLVLRNVLPEADAICEMALKGFARKDVAKDDIADALAALATAVAPRGVQLTTPANPERDSHGLPMQMTYALATQSGQH
jgi:predicted RNase H-like nuclease